MDADEMDAGPTYYYVRDKGKAAAHHWDYIADREDHALCGHPYDDPSPLGEVPRPKQVCRACQERLPEYHAMWWQEKAFELLGERCAAEAELRVLESDFETLKTKFADLQEHSDNQRRTLAVLQPKIRDLKAALENATKASDGRKVTSGSKTPAVVGAAGIVKGSEQAAIAAGVAIRRASDALVQLCQVRPGAISHHEVTEVMNRVIASLDDAQRQLLEAETNRYGSPLAWARAELKAMGRRVT